MLIDPNMTVDQMRGIVGQAYQKLDPGAAAFLFATGKSELEVRDLIALHLHGELSFLQTSIREWKRHDFAVLDQEAKPVLLVEGKSWAHADAISPKKLMVGSKSIKTALDNDLVKLKKAKDKYPEVNCFVTTILFTVEVPERDYSYKSTEIVKYADLHRKAISKFSSPDLMMSAGLTNARELFEEYGDVMWLPLWSSDYHGMKVSSEILILHPHLDDPNFKSSMRMK